MEEDLARPVITIADFETGTPAYEIYSFNRQVVTVPIGDADDAEDTGVDRLAKNEIEREIQAATRGPVEVDLRGKNTAVVYVSEDDISHVIGKGGGRIADIENRLGMNIDVRTLADQPDRGDATAGGNQTGSGGALGGGAGGASTRSKPPGEIVTPEITSRHVIIPVDDSTSGATVEVQADGEYLFTATVGRGGDIKVSRGSAIAEDLERAIDREHMITVVAD
jgi:ATPase